MPTAAVSQMVAAVVRAADRSVARVRMMPPAETDAGHDLRGDAGRVETGDAVGETSGSRTLDTRTMSAAVSPTMARGGCPRFSADLALEPDQGGQHERQHHPRDLSEVGVHEVVPSLGHPVVPGRAGLVRLQQWYPTVRRPADEPWGRRVD